jgi:hypothetical protein
MPHSIFKKLKTVGGLTTLQAELDRKTALKKEKKKKPASEVKARREDDKRKSEQTVTRCSARYCY